MVLSVYTITGLTSTTVSDAAANSGDPITLTVDVPEGAMLIAVAHGGDGNHPYTSVTGATVDEAGNDSFNNYWAGHAENLSADASYDVVFQRDNGWSAAAVAVWR